MRFVVSNGEKEIAELVARIFDVKGRNAAETAKKAEAALLNANPHLRDLSKVRPGTLVVIPDLPDSPPVRGTQTVGAEAELHDHLSAALEELKSAIERSVDREELAATAATTLLKAPDLKEFFQSSELKERSKKIANAAADQLKEAKATAVAQKTALSQLQEDFGKFNF